MALLQIFDPKARPAPIGIDLGTTHSLVARVVDGRPECIADCNLEVLLPSVVHYGPQGAWWAATPRALAAMHPRETIVSVKRFMGRGADDAGDAAARHLRLRAASRGEEEANVRALPRGGPRGVAGGGVGGDPPKALRSSPRTSLRTVGGVVITVPAYFDDAQRQATKDAGRLAGLEVLRLLNEPTAAALAYGLEKQHERALRRLRPRRRHLRHHRPSLDDGVFQVKSTGGDSALGGDDMDRALASAPARDGRVTTARSREVVRLALDAARR
jgi:molecular chaperone HscA